MLHDVRLDKWQRRAGIVGENVHGHVCRERIGNQHFEPRVFVAEKRRFGYFSFVAGKKSWRRLPGEWLESFFENEQPGFFRRAENFIFRSRRQKCKTTFAQSNAVHLRFSADDVKK